MCAVPNMAVFWSSLTSYFPGMLLTYFLNDFEIVPVAPIITGITFVFTFHMRCISIIIIIEFLTSQIWLGNIHLSWDVVINRIRLGGLICSLKSFLQLLLLLLRGKQSHASNPQASLEPEYTSVSNSA